MQLLAYSLLLLLGGWLLRGIVGGRWRTLRNPHRFGDSRHLWLEIEGELHAFTDDQLAAAVTRARRMDDPRRRWLRASLWLLLIGALAAVALMSGCSKAEHQLSTGKVIAGAQLPGIRGDAQYAEVNPDCLPSLYDDFRAELSQRGLVKWDSRFDCNRFAVHYISKAQTRYAVAAWQSSTPAQALALAEVWYRRSDGLLHAVVQARTPEGDIFIEPQTGQRLPPIADSQIFLRKW